MLNRDIHFLSADKNRITRMRNGLDILLDAEDNVTATAEGLITGYLLNPHAGSLQAPDSSNKRAPLAASSLFQSQLSGVLICNISFNCIWAVKSLLDFLVYSIILVLK
ncbi:hypothetical protein AVEN_27417-1 [Araneus ventricosus]|uniref:Uncharacterized protein n=1 Tax=Araneus ventricosus TaxID=182803 RepID=A0A4Y2EJF0_ARAVE|nr:hypothetical protein AVEN_27417-1 [Araneus ventricosus]